MEFKKRKERQERKERTGQGSLMDAMTIDYEQVSNSIVNFIRQKVAEAGKDGRDEGCLQSGQILHTELPFPYRDFFQVLLHLKSVQ